MQKKKKNYKNIVNTFRMYYNVKKDYLKNTVLYITSVPSSTQRSKEFTIRIRLI